MSNAHLKACWNCGSVIFGGIVGVAANLFIQAGGQGRALEVVPMGALSVWNGRLRGLQLNVLISVNTMVSGKHAKIHRRECMSAHTWGHAGKRKMERVQACTQTHAEKQAHAFACIS